MKRLTWLVAAAAAATVCAASADAQRRGKPGDMPLGANPSAVIAAELGFARLAQEKGQWTAFAEYAADDAVMFVPQAVKAKDWLRKQKNPPKAVAWQPHQVWSSCDGTLAVTKGAWQRPDGSVGYFTTIWQRQPKKGEYKWVLDQGDTLAQPIEAPEFVQASVADCPRGRRGPPPGRRDAEAVPVPKSSNDGTLRYDWSVAAGGARRVTVEMLVDGEMTTVLTSDVAPAE